jgi:hypothetical protein
MTSFIQLTEMWRDHKYMQVGQTIRREHWSPERTAEFCAYFCKFLGTSQLNILYKFI